MEQILDIEIPIQLTSLDQKTVTIQEIISSMPIIIHHIIFRIIHSIRFILMQNTEGIIISTDSNLDLEMTQKMKAETKMVLVLVMVEDST